MEKGKRQMNEQWRLWEPALNLSNRYSIDYIHFNTRGLKIVLSEMKQEYKTVEVLFKDSVIAYTKTDESLILDLEGDLKQIRASQCPGGWTFFKTINSKYVKQITESCGYFIADHVHWIHFVLLADDAMINVIADYDPEIVTRNWDIRTRMLLYKERIIPVILQQFPKTKIILYGPRARAQVPVEKYGINPIQIALDIGCNIDLKALKELKETILHESAVNVPCDIVDLYAVSGELRQQILQEGIDWVKAKHI